MLQLLDSDFFLPPALDRKPGTRCPSMWTHQMWVYSFHLSWVPGEELLETLPHELLGRALGERMQRKEVNIPCKDRQLSDFEELGFQSQVARHSPSSPLFLPLCEIRQSVFVLA